MFGTFLQMGCGLKGVVKMVVFAFCPTPLVTISVLKGNYKFRCMQGGLFCRGKAWAFKALYGGYYFFFSFLNTKVGISMPHLQHLQRWVVM